MLNRQGVSWFDWLKDAGHTTGTVMRLSPHQHKTLRQAWHDCSDPTQYRPVEVIYRTRTCKDVATTEE